MKSHTSLVTAIFAGALLCSGSVLAQDQQSTSTTTGQAHYNTPHGELTVRSHEAPGPSAQPPPSFEQLSGGGKSISIEQAAAYPPLANDFDYADRNRDKHISRSEYEQWLKHF